MARIATGNYDAVIVSHRSFEFLPVSDELFNRFIDQEVRQLEDAILEAKAEKGDNRRIVKELEKAKKRLVAKLKKRADRERKDDTLTFEELGVDQVFVDEADLYKNLFYTTKMNRIAGLPNTDSNRAFDMFIKTRYIREINGGRGVVFATGTPISNTMAEMYTMLRYLGPDLLQRARRRAFRRLGREFRGSGHGARTGSGRLGLPDAHALCEIHQSAGTALDVPHLLRRADRRHAESAAPERDGRQAADRRGPGERGAQGATSRRLTERAERLRTQRVDPSRGQHAEDHGRRPQGRPRYAPGRALCRCRRDSAKVANARQPHQGRLARQPRSALDTARLLRSLDARPRTVSTSMTNSAPGSSRAAFPNGKSPSSTMPIPMPPR